ncbi:MAG: response regulator [Spirochaetaceae bacterium]|nr:MAG: response regulator [Spirochaetaceae bacterium]
MSGAQRVRGRERGTMRRLMGTEANEDLLSGFRREERNKAVGDLRRTAVVASIAFAFFGVLDTVVYPGLAGRLLLSRLVVIAGNIVVFVAIRHAVPRAHARFVAMLEYLLCSGAIVWMTHLTGGYSSPYYAGINLVLLAFIFILPIGGPRTAVVCVLVYVAYIAPTVIAFRGIQDVPILLSNNFFLLATIGLVTMSAYLAERMRLHEYASRYRLAKANEELKTMDQLKSQFFANISHEVRTPLTSIISPVQALYQGDAGDLSDDQHQLVSQVYRNGLRLLDMINQMLDFAKYDARKMELRLSWVDLAELVEDMVAVFNEVTRRKQLEMRVIARGPIPGAYLDREKLERILSNLIRNAIKFTDRGSITIELAAERGAISIEVSDTGIGIPEERLGIIFERFQQVDGSSTRRYEGTGLGLAIVKEAVDLQNGSIDVESVVGAGATFRVVLPDNLEILAPEAFIERRDTSDRRRREESFSGPDRRRELRRRRDAAEVAPGELAMVEAVALPVRVERGEASPQSAVHVLYVEDNADLRAFVSRMLVHLGYRVTTAEDGQDGWERIGTEAPDVVVSDVMMPRMDGFELLQRVRTSDHLAGMPMILITAKSEVESRIEGLQFGADDYLAKPINIRELDARVKNLLNLRRMKAAEARAEQLEERIEELSLGFSRALELRDRYTAGHSNDVLTYGSIIAEEMGMSIDVTLREALLLHDIGKLGIPDSILLKEGPLDEKEWEVMKSHAELGASLLRAFESFQAVSDIILAHQEHYDGSGYPRGLQREEIPIEARIISVADSWHAMTEDRPYRKALSGLQAVAELQRHRGRQFDPQVVDAFLSALTRRGIIDPPDLRDLAETDEYRN